MSQVSIIIPIYNCEKQINKCLDSVISQTFNDFECILVNDGSTDNSEIICKEYASNDNRFIYIKQKNGGASAARNAGLTVSTSKYVCFIDADDYVSPSYLQDLISDAEDNDLVIHGMTRICSDRIIDRGMHINGKFDLSNNPSLFFDSINIERFGGPVCKLFCADIIKYNQLWFNTKIKLAEDLDFLLRYLPYCSRIKVSSKNNYYYIETPGSATSRIYSFESEFNGLCELSKSWDGLTSKFQLDSLYNLSNKSKAYLAHRAIFSVFKRGSNFKTRQSQLRLIASKSKKHYKYYSSTTLFLKLEKFLFNHNMLYILNMVMSLRLI